MLLFSSQAAHPLSWDSRPRFKILFFPSSERFSPFDIFSLGAVFTLVGSLLPHSSLLVNLVRSSRRASAPSLPLDIDLMSSRLLHSLPEFRVSFGSNPHFQKIVPVFAPPALGGPILFHSVPTPFPPHLSRRVFITFQWVLKSIRCFFPPKLPLCAILFSLLACVVSPPVEQILAVLLNSSFSPNLECHSFSPQSSPTLYDNRPPPSLFPERLIFGLRSLGVQT